MKICTDIGLNKYHHSSAISVNTAVNNLINIITKLDDDKYDNEASMSDMDKEEYIKSAQKKIIEYINTLIGKMEKVSISDIAYVLGISEKLVIETVKDLNMYIEEERE